MGWSKCKFCGETIVWARMPGGNYLPMEPYDGGRHECTPFSHGESKDNTDRSRSWSVADASLPVTHRTKCWWCGEEVYFHTNGNGDCVLFDKLGWPWPIHPCWAENAGERAHALSAVDASLEQAGFDGQFYDTAENSATAGEDGTEVTVEGYIADNHALYDEPNEVVLRATSESDSSAFNLIDIKDESGNLFSFLVPEAEATNFQDYALVRVTGVWKIHESVPHLIATSLIERRYLPQSTDQTIKWETDQRFTDCHYCGCRLSTSKEWGIDSSCNPVCRTCAKASAGFSPDEFIALCRRVASRHA